MAIYISPDEDAFTTNLGKIVTRWNQLEALLKMSVRMLAGANHAVDILTAQLGNMDLFHSAQALSALRLNGYHLDHFTHFLKMYDRLRNLRNFFVHGISWCGQQEDGGAVALFQTVKAKGKLTFGSYWVRPHELEETVAQLEVALDYLQRISIDILLQDDGPGKSPIVTRVDLATLSKPALPRLINMTSFPVVGP